MLNVLLAEGRLLKDPTLQITEKNFAYSRATLVSRRSFKNKETVEYESDFLQLYLTKEQAKNFSSLCHKGDLISIQGRLQTERRKSANGEASYYTNVVVSSFNLLVKKKIEAVKAPQSFSQNKNDAPAFQRAEGGIDTNFEAMSLPPEPSHFSEEY